MDINWSYKNKSRVFDTKENGGVPYLSFKALDDTGLAVNGFSTRMGGASRGKFSTMNFSYSRGDAAEDVLENFTRMAAALGVERDRMVVSHQTHTVNLRRVTLEDAGKGVIRERDYRDIDGLITDVPGLTLVTFYADCVPLYLLDPVNRAIGLSHSGWRGTVKRMGQVTVDAMKEAFGTKPEDLIACVGPSICRDCFEVGGEVVEEFREAFGPEHREALYCQGKRPGKYQLDLWKANEAICLSAGISPEHISVTDVCTCCNPTYLFSHRASNGRRGNLGMFVVLN